MVASDVKEFIIDKTPAMAKVATTGRAKLKTEQKKELEPIPINEMLSDPSITRM